MQIDFGFEVLWDPLFWELLYHGDDFHRPYPNWPSFITCHEKKLRAGVTLLETQRMCLCIILQLVIDFWCPLFWMISQIILRCPLCWISGKRTLCPRIMCLRRFSVGERFAMLFFACTFSSIFAWTTILGCANTVLLVCFQLVPYDVRMFFHPRTISLSFPAKLSALLSASMFCATREAWLSLRISTRYFPCS